MNIEKSHNEDFITKLTKNEHGFSVPKDYLGSLEENIMCRLTEDKLPKETSFKTPKNYLDNIETEIFSKTINSKTKVISLQKRILQLIPTAAAASILLFIGLHYFSTPLNYAFDTISNDDLEIWLDENYDLSTSLEFVDSDFTDSNIIENETSLEDEDILDYFNTIDNSTLLTEID